MYGPRLPPLPLEKHRMKKMKKMKNSKPRKKKVKKIKKTKKTEKDEVRLYCAPVDPYDQALFWSWAPTPELFAEEMKRTLPNLTITPIPEQGNGHCEIIFDGQQYFPIIWVSNPDEPWVLAHELEHFVHWLLGYKGLKFTDDSEEAYAYLLSYLMQLMMESRREGRY